MPELNSVNCKVPPPEPQLRDTASIIFEQLDKANSLADTIGDKLFNNGQCEASDKACPPSDLQNSLKVAQRSLSVLLNKLDGINSRI